MRLVLLGDGQSPHLLKWALALAAVPGLELWAASSRGWLPELAALLPPARRLALNTQPHTGGGNASLLRQLPRLAGWLKQVDADWINPHYLTSHGTMAWLAKRLWGLRGRLVGSAWGSDILVTPTQSRLVAAVTRRVLRACVLCTSDSQHMAQRMRALGAHEVMVFPFGLQVLPDAPKAKDPTLFFANRGLEPIYEPARVLAQFAALAGADDRLVVANDGSLRAALQQQVHDMGLAGRVQFVGRLDASTQAGYYANARWYLSLPQSDSVAVSVLEALAHGCLPLLSDLPANCELVQHGINGLIVPAGQLLGRTALDAMAPQADTIARRNREWVSEHAMLAPCVDRFVARLQALA